MRDQIIKKRFKTEFLGLGYKKTVWNRIWMHIVHWVHERSNNKERLVQETIQSRIFRAGIQEDRLESNEGEFIGIVFGCILSIGYMKALKSILCDCT